MATLDADQTESSSPVVWRDHKRYLWLIGMMVPTFPFVGWGLATLTGWGLFYYFAPALILGVIPLVDVIVGVDRSNPPEDMIGLLEEDRYYRWVTYAFLPLHYVVLIWGAWLWTYGSLTPFEMFGLAVSVGTVSGVGIGTAHELGHKRANLERWLAKIALAPSFYGHFYVEHNRGHHVRVATPDDPASSRLGESVYRFLPRTLIGSLQNAWRVEQPRFRRRQQSHWSIRNDVLNAWVISVLLWGLLLAVFGVGVLPYLLIQAVIGILLLELVNYLEHYGMLRQPVATGRWERVRPSHSWNSNNIATNLLLYHLQRHSDHHANPTRRYQSLRDHEEAPVLPTGYSGMILLALVPPLWRRVMDPRVVAHFDGDVTKANIAPGKRDAVVSRYSNTGSSRLRCPPEAGFRRARKP